MAVKIEEAGNVLKHWGESVLRDVDSKLGNHDGWLEKSDFKHFDSDGISSREWQVVRQSLLYAHQFNAKGVLAQFHADLPVKLKTMSQAAERERSSDFTAEEFGELMIECIAAISGHQTTELIENILTPATLISDHDKGSAVSYQVNWDDPVMQELRSYDFLSQFDLSTQSQGFKARDVNGKVVSFVYRHLENIAPEQLYFTLNAQGFTRASEFGAKHAPFKTTLSYAEKDGVLDVDMYGEYQFFMVTTNLLGRQKSYYNDQTREWVVEGASLPQSKVYTDFLSTRGITATNADDSKGYSIWRLKSDGHGGSYVVLGFYSETIEKVPNWLEKKIYSFIVPEMFKAYKEGVELIVDVQQRIDAAGAAEAEM